MRTIRTGTGRQTLDRHLKRLGERAEKGNIAAAEVLLEESLKLVPEDTGALRDSATITQVGEGTLSIIYVGYGLRNRLGQVIRGPGPTNWPQHRHSAKEKRDVWRVPANYAWIQHFNHSLKHTKGQANYLGEPSRTKVPQMRSAFRQAFIAG